MKAKIIRPQEVKPLILDPTYSSKMILDDTLAGEETVQINEGTLKGGCSTAGGVHEKAEIYYIAKGEAVITLGDEKSDIKVGDLIFIPGGVFHALKNKSATEEFVLLTLWMKAEYNEVYNLRLQKWGKSFKTIYEE